MDVPRLAGTRWVLAGTVAADTGELTPAAAVATLDFDRDGSALSGSTGCNRFRGSFEQRGSALTITLGPMTLMACIDEAVDAQERALLRLLPGVAAFALADTLTLRDETGQTVLVYGPGIDSLGGTSWVATGVNDGAHAVVSDALTDTVTAEFGDDGRVSGSTGCNRYRGEVETSTSGEMRIRNVATTRRAGSPEAMELERRFLAALERVTTYRIDGITLTLRDAGGATQVAWRLASGPSASDADEGEPVR